MTHVLLTTLFLYRMAMLAAARPLVVDHRNDTPGIIGGLFERVYRAATDPLLFLSARGHVGFRRRDLPHLESPVALFRRDDDDSLGIPGLSKWANALVWLAVCTVGPFIVFMVGWIALMLYRGGRERVYERLPWLKSFGLRKKPSAKPQKGSEAPTQNGSTPTKPPAPVMDSSKQSDAAPPFPVPEPASPEKTSPSESTVVFPEPMHVR